MLSRKLLMAGQTPRVYATFSPDSARKSSAITLSNGNLTAALNNASHQAVFLTVDKTSGLWACEFTNLALFTGSKVSSFGFTTAFSLALKLGVYPYGVGYQPYDGSKNKDTMLGGATTTLNFWRTISSANTTHLVVFDFDNKQIYCANPGNTALLSSSIPAIDENLYVGLSMYGLSTSTTLNAGQSAFTAANEALIDAYETANSVTVNRGLWA